MERSRGRERSPSRRTANRARLLFTVRTPTDRSSPARLFTIAAKGRVIRYRSFGFGATIFRIRLRSATDVTSERFHLRRGYDVTSRTRISVFSQFSMQLFFERVNQIGGRRVGRRGTDLL